MGRRGRREEGEKCGIAIDRGRGTHTHTIDKANAKKKQRAKRRAMKVRKDMMKGRLSHNAVNGG